MLRAAPAVRALQTLINVGESTHTPFRLLESALQRSRFTTSSTPGSPSTPSASSSPDGGLPMHLQDQILLKGMSFYGYHGARPEEKVLGQRFVLEATLWADLSKSGRSDKLQDTLDYREAYSVIKQVVEGPPKQLQEAVVEEVCERLLALDDRVTAVQVYMWKPHVPLEGILDSIGVQVYRTRKV